MALVGVRIHCRDLCWPQLGQVLIPKTETIKRNGSILRQNSQPRAEHRVTSPRAHGWVRVERRKGSWMLGRVCYRMWEAFHESHT